MTWFMLPAAIALLLKLAILFLARDSARQAPLFIGLITIFALHNTAELSLFLQFTSGETADMIMRTFYTATTLVVLYGAIFTIKVSQFFNKQQSRLIYLSASVYTVVLIGFIWLTGMVINGSHPIAYALTAVKGDYYWLFQIHAISLMVIALSSLILGYLKTPSQKTEVQCAYTLLAITPLIVAALGTIIAMQLGYSVNAMVILPIASTLFLIILLYNESQHSLTDIRRFIPLSLESKISNQLQQAIYQYSTEEKSYKETKSEIEKILVMYKHMKNGESISATARAMSVPRSTVYSIFKKHNLTLPQEN